MPPVKGGGALGKVKVAVSGRENGLMLDVDGVQSVVPFVVRFDDAGAVELETAAVIVTTGTPVVVVWADVDVEEFVKRPEALVVVGELSSGGLPVTPMMGADVVLDAAAELGLSSGGLPVTPVMGVED